MQSFAPTVHLLISIRGRLGCFYAEFRPANSRFPQPLSREANACPTVNYALFVLEQAVVITRDRGQKTAPQARPCPLLASPHLWGKNAGLRLLIKERETRKERSRGDQTEPSRGNGLSDLNFSQPIKIQQKCNLSSLSMTSSDRTRSLQTDASLLRHEISDA